MSGKAAKNVKKRMQYFPLGHLCLSYLSGFTLLCHIGRGMCEYLFFDIHLSKCNN